MPLPDQKLHLQIACFGDEQDAEHCEIILSATICGHEHVVTEVAGPSSFSPVGVDAFLEHPALHSDSLQEAGIHDLQFDVPQECVQTVPSEFLPEQDVLQSRRVSSEGSDVGVLAWVLAIDGEGVEPSPFALVAFDASVGGRLQAPTRTAVVKVARIQLVLIMFDPFILIRLLPRYGRLRIVRSSQANQQLQVNGVPCGLHRDRLRPGVGSTGSVEGRRTPSGYSYQGWFNGEYGSKACEAIGLL